MQNKHINKQQADSKFEKINKNNEETKTVLQQQLAAIFPNKPYPTQLKIASILYKVLQQQKDKAVIVESPTGTGKTYTLLVGVLAWFNKNQYKLQKASKKSQQSSQSKEQSSSMPSWLTGKTAQNKVNKLKQMKQDRINKLKSIKQAKQSKYKKHITVKNDQKVDTNRKPQWQIQDIQDEPFNKQMKSMKRNNMSTMMVQEIFKQQQCLPKIIFVSRTHSQLSQVMDSIKNLPLSFRYASLASKDHLCIHKQMQKTRVHQKCQYLLSHGGCPYYSQQPIRQFIGLSVQQAKKLGEQNSLCSYFAIKNLVPICDILCLPYSSILNPQIRMRLGINIRNAIIIFDQAHNAIQQELSMKSPQINYKQLQQLCARIDQYKLKYGNKMAHNNLFLISHIQQICRAFMTVIAQQYDSKNKINKQNKTQHDENYSQKANEQSDSSYIKISKLQLFFKLGLAQIKVHQIKNYISLSNFDQKLVYFNKQNKDSFSPSILNSFLDFITILTSINQNNSSNNNNNNKLSLKQSHNKIQSTIILIKNLIPLSSEQNIAKKQFGNKGLGDVSMKIFCMQSTQIAQIAKSARLSIFAGGTMQPIGSFTSIFKSANLNYTFTKGAHVIKDEQCNVYCIAGLKYKAKQKQDKINAQQQHINYKLSFTYTNLKHERKRLLTGACKIIKDIVNKTEPKSGIVVFIQNYNLLQPISEHLQQQISNIPIFYDDNDKAKKTNMNAFEMYQKQIREKKNMAILVSVMGGRLSEGINFSDQLARSIVVLGLPYPNIKAPQMAEKMKYLDQKLKSKLEAAKQNNELPGFQSAYKNYMSKSQRQQETGHSYYESCCIKTINQTIGRGIRHINDHANIYLIDSRFAKICHQLSSWLQKRIKHIDYYNC